MESHNSGKPIREYYEKALFAGALHSHSTAVNVIRKASGIVLDFEGEGGVLTIKEILLL
jgi:hypothetical protein